MPGLEFTGDPVTEFGCVIALEKEGRRMSPPEPELIVRCGGRLGAPEAVETAASAAERDGAGDSGSAVFAAVDGRGWLAGVMGRRAIGSLLDIVCGMRGTGEEVGEGCSGSQVSD